MSSIEWTKDPTMREQWDGWTNNNIYYFCIRRMGVSKHAFYRSHVIYANNNGYTKFDDVTTLREAKSMCEDWLQECICRMEEEQMDDELFHERRFYERCMEEKMSRSIDVRHLHWYKNEQGDYIASGYKNLYMIKSIGEGIYRAYYKAWTWSAVVPWKEIVMLDGPFKKSMMLCNDDNEEAVEYGLDDVCFWVRKWG